MARNYNSRAWVYVEMANGIKYAFPSRLKSTLREKLGQVATSTLTEVNGVVVGAQSPKPSRASKRFATGTESSFCASASIPALRNDEWTINTSKTASFAINTSFAKAYKVTINGIKYAFQSADLPSGTAFPAGFTDPRDLVDANDTNLVWGADFPKPPRFSIRSGANTISSYLDETKVDLAKNAGARVAGAKSTLSYFQQKYV